MPCWPMQCGALILSDTFRQLCLELDFEEYSEGLSPLFDSLRQSIFSGLKTKIKTEL